MSRWPGPQGVVGRVQDILSDGVPDLLVEDSGQDPSSNGEVRRNGTDLKAYSGGAVKDLGNIGSGGSSPLYTDTLTETDNRIVADAAADVQTAIDNITGSTHGEGVVELSPNQDYDLTGITVKDGVTLVCSDAAIVPSTDADVFDVHAQGRIIDPFVDLTAFDSWTNTVFTLDSSLDSGMPYVGSGQNGAAIDNPTIIADQTGTATGTGIHVYGNSAGNEITMMEVARSVAIFRDRDTLSGSSQTLGTGIHFQCDAEFVNGNYIRGAFIASCATAVLFNGTDTSLNDNHIVDLEIQPEDGTNSDIGIDYQNGENNVCQGFIWDNVSWDTASIRAGSGTGPNYFVSPAVGPGDGTGVRGTLVNNGNHDSIILENIGGSNRRGHRAINNETERLLIGETAESSANSSATTINMPTNPINGDSCFAHINNDTNGVTIATTDTADFDNGDSSSISASTGEVYTLVYKGSTDSWYAQVT